MKVQWALDTPNWYEQGRKVDRIRKSQGEKLKEMTTHSPLGFYCLGQTLPGVATPNLGCI